MILQRHYLTVAILQMRKIKNHSSLIFSYFRTAILMSDTIVGICG